VAMDKDSSTSPSPWRPQRVSGTRHGRGRAHFP
jgi:hypothetical protein